jgi:hypothetical protein
MSLLNAEGAAEADAADESTTETDAAADEAETSEDTGEQDTHKPEFEEDPNAEAKENDKLKLVNEDGLYFGKYKDEAEAVKAFKNLESENGRLRREKVPEAPEEYDFDLSNDEDLKEFEHLAANLNLSDDPIMKELQPVMQKHGISQDAATELAKTYLKADFSQAPDPGEEKKKLGDNADQVIEDVNKFVARNFSEDERSAVEQFASTADNIKVLHKISQMAGSKNIPTDANVGPTESAAELMDKASELKRKHGGRLYGEPAREYEKLMDRAAQMQIKTSR